MAEHFMTLAEARDVVWAEAEQIEICINDGMTVTETAAMLGISVETAQAYRAATARLVAAVTGTRTAPAEPERTP